MIIKTINDIDRFYDLLYSKGMQGPIDLNVFNPHNNFYSSDIGVYYVIKKKHIIFYYENGEPGKNGMIQLSKDYVITRIVCKKGEYKLVGEYIPNPFALIFLVCVSILFPIGILLGVLLMYLLAYSDFEEIRLFIDDICK